MSTNFEEISRQAAANASNALSKLIDKPVIVDVAKTAIKDIMELEPFLGTEERVAGIYLPVTGDVKGATLLILPEESAFTLSDLLLKRKAGTTRSLTELDKSALKEVGNIIAGNYLTVLANELQVKVIEHIPSFSLDMFGAILSQIIAKFTEQAEKALVVEVEFDFKPIKITGYFVLLLRLTELMAIFGEKTITEGALK